MVKSTSESYSLRDRSSKPEIELNSHNAKDSKLYSLSLDRDAFKQAPLILRQLRAKLREPFAEFLGVTILVIFGNGVNCQVVLSGDTKVAPSSRGNYFSINIGWGVGTAMGVWVSAGISGGHINPAVTLALASFRGFPWRKVPVYIFAQVLGGFVGAGIIYSNYFHAINIFEGTRVRTSATSGLFATYATSYLTNTSAFFSEFLGTAVLMLVVLALGDPSNTPHAPGIAPLVLFLLITGIGTSLGMETGYAINPARDFGPRLFTAAAGYGREVWTFRHQYWLWCPILAPCIGALFAGVVYDLFLFNGDVSPISRRFLVVEETPGNKDIASNETV